MIYKELINDLKKIKAPNNVNEDLLNHLTTASIDAHMSFFLKDNQMDEHEAFEMTRTMLLKHLDLLMLQIMGDMELDSDMENDNDSPMNDPELNKAIQNAIDGYNQKLDKKKDSKIVKLK